MNQEELFEKVAVVGMACRFPGANSPDEFWQNILQGKESITYYTKDELIEANIDSQLLDNANYILARGDIEEIDKFDASFFNYSPKEAALMDPQHRILLECAWHALEDAGYDAARYDGRIGVFAGESMNTYLLLNLMPLLKQKIASASTLQAAIGNDKDSLTTTISYAMGLTGPAITVQSSSSTSLTAISVACQSLLNYQCDMALAGGVSIGVPKKNGYLYQEGGIVSSDGHCKPFDDSADGFVPGNGAGIVLLKRLSEALEDNDHIYAVVSGYAINNDGNKKVSYSAPSIDAQAEVITEAQDLSGIPIESIRYIEAHGTGTKMGDPIEIAALSKAFERKTKRRGFCAVGSVKGNIGHLDTAAGVAGFIKACMILKNRMIPPSINFKNPNRQIDFINSPFFVTTEGKEWPIDEKVAYAGVNSWGMGGTNVHIILEEAPKFLEESVRDMSKRFIFTLSAKTENSLRRMIKLLIMHIKDNSSVNLEKLAYTLQMGRRELPIRCSVSFNTYNELLCKLEKLVNSKNIGICGKTSAAAVFVFPGQGTQYIGMAESLYKEVKIFRKYILECEDIFLKLTGKSIVKEIFHESKKNNQEKMPMEMDQIAIFIIEYSLAMTLINFGIKPLYAIGHSIGEYAAVCVAGGITLRDALYMLVNRSKRMVEMPKGAMLAIELPSTQINDYLVKGISLAAINAHNQFVISGDKNVIKSIQEKLINTGVRCKQLNTQFAFHSWMMEKAALMYKNDIEDISYNDFAFPIISTVNGELLSKENLDARYWSEQIVKPVQFYEAICKGMELEAPVFLEIGVGNNLCNLIKRSASKSIPEPIWFIPHEKEKNNTLNSFYDGIGSMWCQNLSISWEYFYESNNIGRVSLPGYSFDKQSYWIDNDNKEQDDIKNKNVKKELERQQNKITYNEIYIFMESLWKELFMLDSIEKDKNFFSIGGDSIAIIQLFDAVNEKFPQILNVADFFVLATLEEQVNAIYKKVNDNNQRKDILEEKSTYDVLIEEIQKGKINIEEAIDKISTE